ncbi:fido domain-containing protein [Apodospora peruviana]|uniref:Fido domain-containing protein n=1 Tax=Apodospora peruviana TaxID=516989 RepID=A0AAE0M909_9PEZI|nr:fido domain-containing protein [Apodospora peruviana]
MSNHVELTDLSASLSKAFASGWPTWRSTRHHGRQPATDTFKIRLTSELRSRQNTYVKSELGPPSSRHAGTGSEQTNMDLDETDPTLIISIARFTSARAGSNLFSGWVWDGVEEELATLVYGSNKIESAGSSLAITSKLCRDVFRGNFVPWYIREGTPDYEEHIKYLEQTQRKSDKIGVYRSRLGVIQHALALNFLIEKVVVEGHDLTEALILRTHAILYHGLEHDGVVKGKYRTYEVAVSYGKPGEETKRLSMPSAVPRYMKELVAHLKEDIVNAENDGEMDPYTLAARYHHGFIMVHPFGDGNGRMSRIILNVLLLKYAGHLCLFGSDDQDKDEYLAVVERCAKVFNDEDLVVEFQKQTSHQEFALYVLSRSNRSLKAMAGWAIRWS